MNQDLLDQLIPNSSLIGDDMELRELLLYKPNLKENKHPNHLENTHDYKVDSENAS